MKLLFVLAYLFLLNSSAQEEIGKQVWIDVTPRWYTTEHLKIKGEFGIRKELNNYDWLSYVASPSAFYALFHGLNIGGGLGMKYTKTADTNNVVLDDRFEFVPYQGVNYTHSLSQRWKLNYYFRLEEKFDYNTQTWTSLNSLRMRFRIRAMYDFNAYQEGRYYRATLSWEGFKTLSGEDGLFTKKSRVTLGFERSFSHAQKGRVEITWQRQSFGIDSGTDINDYSDIYFRLRYYPSWGKVIKNKFLHTH